MSGTNFTATPVSGIVPKLVAFTDTTDPTPIAWLWNFGDGATSTSQNPAHLYSTVGSFNVSLTTTLPSSSGLSFGVPFNIPTTNTAAAVTVTGPVTAGSVLTFSASATYQSYVAALTQAPAVFNGFSAVFEVARQAGSTGLNWAVELTVGGRTININYGSSNANPVRDNTIQIKEQGSELYYAAASHGGVDFWPTASSVATVSLILNGTNLQVLVEYTIPEVSANQIEFANLTLGHNYSSTSTFLSNILITSSAMSAISGHVGPEPAKFNSFTVIGTAVAQTTLATYTKSAFITTSADSNPQLTKVLASVHRHVQTTASDTWVVAHNLQQYPAVDIYIDYLGEKHRILPLDVVYNDANTCTITFSVPRTGFATVA